MKNKQSDDMLWLYLLQIINICPLILSHNRYANFNSLSVRKARCGDNAIRGKTLETSKKISGFIKCFTNLCLLLHVSAFVVML